MLIKLDSEHSSQWVGSANKYGVPRSERLFVLEKASGRFSGLLTALRALSSTCRSTCFGTRAARHCVASAVCFEWIRLSLLERKQHRRGHNHVDEIALLGNRVDRYHWNGSVLTYDQNLIKLRALQQDAGQPSRGNHNGGVLRFGPDGKLYIIMGDNGRRGLLQNIVTGGPVPDDQFGGPEPDDAHLTGVILRLNDDGTTPTDNPFYNAATTLTGAAATNVKKVFAYGVRNGFGMAFDPLAGYLWTQENGDDAFDEMNRCRRASTVDPGHGPDQSNRPVQVHRINLRRRHAAAIRWPPSNMQHASGCVSCSLPVARLAVYRSGI